EEAVVRRLLGQCTLANGKCDAAEGHLRSTLALQTELGTALEAARTRLALAQALGRGTEGTKVPAEALVLLAEARAGFAASGATLDLAQAEDLAAAWAAHQCMDQR